MAGILNPNIPTVFFDQGYIDGRAVEVPDANWLDGLNLGGSCAGGLGINTGDFNPKNQDWWREDAPTEAFSGYIGIDSSPDNLITGLSDEDWKRVAFVQPSSDTLDGAVLTTYLAVNVVNQTGVTVPAGQWVWGIMDA
jgi:hypothetical protein